MNLKTLILFRSLSSFVTGKFTFYFDLFDCNIAACTIDKKLKILTRIDKMIGEWISLMRITQTFKYELIKALDLMEMKLQAYL